MTRQYNLHGYVRLRPGGTKGGSVGQLSVPTAMMIHLTLGSYFKPEFTDEGILFRFAAEVAADAVQSPAWASSASADAKAAASKKDPS